MAIMSPDELEQRLQNVNPTLANVVRQMYQESGGRIGVTGHGGWRDSAQQAKMYQDYLNGGNLAAKPGSSMHEKGLAIDFAVEGDDYGYLASVASKYGLVNSVDGEPWHYTMGDDVQAEGFDQQLSYDVGETENPEDALANRLNAVFSMIEGGGPAGTESAGYTHTAVQELAGQEPGAIAQSASLGALTGNAMGQYALQKFKEYGWSPAELQALTILWNKESGDPRNTTEITWNPNADNPTSSAAGIAQKMTSIHGPVEPSYQGQIDWGLEYIMGRYGSPSKALAFHQKNNWY